MQIMILSDSHSMKKNDLIKIINRHPADYYIYCGDIFMPYTDMNIDHFYIVKGNNDRPPVPENLTLEIDGLNFYIVHGHLYHVDSGIHELEKYAKENHIDVVCFGHTHQPTYIVQNEITYINPGSVTYPRGKYRYPTYCLFDTKTKKVTFYNVKNDELCDPFQTEPKKKLSFRHIFHKKR